MRLLVACTPCLDNITDVSAALVRDLDKLNMHFWSTRELNILPVCNRTSHIYLRKEGIVAREWLI